MAQASLLRRFFRGIGRGIDMLRTVLGRLLFLLIVGFILYALFAGPAVVRVPETAALVLAPTGNIVEKRTQPALANTLLGGQAVQDTVLQDLLDAIERGAGDSRIASLVLHLDELQGINPTHMESLEEALQRFRESGKPIYAYGDYYSQGQYALAAHADNITLNPMGNLILQGYGGNQLFFRELLDSLSVNMHVFRVGEFKSATEPFTRMDMSEVVRENNQALVDELWGRYLQRVSRARDIDETVLRRYADELPRLVAQAEGNMARVALEQGLVDEVAGLETFRRQMAARVGQGNATFRQIHHRDYLRATAGPQLVPGEQGQVAVLVAEGTIVPGDQTASGVVAEEPTLALIRQARADDDIRALVVRVNSPGGGMLSSEAIRSELELLQAQGKPVIVSMGPTAASGGYWIAAGADEIWASPTTITGSIGVTAMIPTFENTLSEIGVATDGVSTTPLSRGDALGGLNEPMRQIFQSNTENAYRRFVSIVAEGREMSMDQAEAQAQGRVMTGRAALEAGLVDELGELSGAVAAAARHAGLEEWRTVTLERPVSLLEELLMQTVESASPTRDLRAMLGLSALDALPVRDWRILADLLLPQARNPQRLQPLVICELCISFRPH